MKKIAIIITLFCVIGVFSPTQAQDETRVTGTVKVHPWIDLPVVISTDLQGGLQSLGALALTATPATVLNATVPAFERAVGMVVTAIDSDNNNQTRYFEYLGTDAWREVFVMNAWEPSHGYFPGDYVVYDGNFYVANTTFTSDATTFATDASKWNNAGGKDGKYTTTEIKMDSQTLTKVAASATTVADIDKDITLATAGYVLANGGGGGISFDIDRPVTLSGTNVSGLNLGAGGKTMSEFLEAFFFPAVPATPPSTTLSTAQTTFPYSTWKNWGSYTNNLTFSWSVTNNSQSDNTDDKAITSIKLKSGATELASVASPSGGTESGSFTNIPIQNTNGNVTTDFTKTYTLEVIDAEPNTVNKNVTVTMSKAIQLTYGNPTLTPATTVYEYDVNNKAITLNWSITPNDEAITNIQVNGSSTGSTSATGSTPVTFLTIANGGTQTKAFPLVVTGDLYGAGATRNSPTVSWENRLYRGVITSATPPCDGGFTFTDNQVRTELITESKLGGNWKSTAGYDFTCGAGGQYIVFAYPDDGSTPTVQYYDSNFNSWMTYSTSDIKVIDRANFVNQNGYNGTNYKLVFVCVQYFSATVKLRIQ